MGCGIEELELNNRSGERLELERLAFCATRLGRFPGRVTDFGSQCLALCSRLRVVKGLSGSVAASDFLLGSLPLEVSTKVTLSNPVHPSFDDVVDVTLSGEMGTIQAFPTENCLRVAFKGIQSKRVTHEALRYADLRGLVETEALEIREWRGGYSVRGGFAQFAFENCPVLEEVVLPAQIVQLPREVFRNCPRLSRVDTAGCVGLLCIDWGAFSGCLSLRELQMPRSLRYVGTLYGGATLAELCDRRDGSLGGSAWEGLGPSALDLSQCDKLKILCLTSQLPVERLLLPYSKLLSVGLDVPGICGLVSGAARLALRGWVDRLELTTMCGELATRLRGRLFVLAEVVKELSRPGMPL